MRDLFFLLAHLTWGGTSEQRNLFSQSPNPSSSPLEQSSPCLSQDSNGCVSKANSTGVAPQSSRRGANIKGMVKKYRNHPAAGLGKPQDNASAISFPISMEEKQPLFPFSSGGEATALPSDRSEFQGSCLTSGCSINTSTLHKHRPPGPHPIRINL